MGMVASIIDVWGYDREFCSINVLYFSCCYTCCDNISGELVAHLRFVVFEYCSGSDLFNFLVTGPFERMKK